MSKAYSLYEGSFSVDKTKVFIPFDPQKDDPKDRPGSLFIHVHPFLIDSPDGLIICDAGLGQYDETGELLIVENIKKLGYSPMDVRYVLMSHLHKDHVGGMVDVKQGEVTFPNAVYVIQENEWASVISDRSDESLNTIWEVLLNSGKIQFVDGSGKINDGIHFELTGAHTQYHQVFHIYTDESHYFFGGDVLPEPEEIFINYIAKYDLDGRLARDLRKKYWKEGAPENWKFLFYHSKSIVIGTSKEKPDGEYILVGVE